MPGRVPEHVIQQVARSANIARLVGRYSELKQRGKSLWGLCPFHKEKTPSFKVDPELGLYYCFGCKEAGNVFTFLNKVEGLEFHEALERLAREAGIDLSSYRGGDGPSGKELDKLREISELAATFYHKCLAKSNSAEHARDYLKQRKIAEESVERWRLGYAPAGWENFLELARGRGLDERLLEAAGLIVARSEGGGYYDRFRNRLMFPVTDRAGRTIGFGARALSEQDEPKYLNSPEGPLFSKGRCFYGFCEAREAVRAGKAAVIVEGYTDVIMAHQFGVQPVMAVLGTALTEEHARMLGALCERVILVFDADEAGQNSAARSIEVLLGEDLDVRVASLGNDEDPCDFLLSHGPEEFRRRLEESVDFLDFRLRRVSESCDMQTVTGRSKAFEELAGMAVKIQNQARRDMLVRQIATQVQVDPPTAFAYLQQLWSQGRPPAGRTLEFSKRGVRVYDEGVAFDLLGLLLLSPEHQAIACNEFDVSCLPSCSEKDLLERLLFRCRESGPEESAGFVNSLEDPELIALATRAMEEEQKCRQASKVTGVNRRYQLILEQAIVRRETRREDEALRSAAIKSTSTTTTSTTSTTTQAPGINAPPLSMEGNTELLREYERVRREKDEAESRRINPTKSSRKEAK